MKAKNQNSRWAAKFRDSRWQKLRLQVMERDEWTCQSCKSFGEGVTLNVHHAYYESGKDPWEYPENTLITWCEDCHKTRHWFSKEINRALVRYSKRQIEGVVYAIALSDWSEVFETVTRDIDPEAVFFLITAITSQIAATQEEEREANHG